MERTLLAQASADLAKRLAASSALPVLGKDLLPLITGVVVVVDLAMRHWVSAESVWNGDTLAIAAPLWLRTYQSSYSGSGLRSNRLPALGGPLATTTARSTTAPFWRTSR